MRASRRITVVGYFIAAAVVGFVVVSVFFAHQFTGVHRRPLHDQPQRYLTHYEEVSFSATDGILLSGWYGPAAGAKQAVVLLHGFGSERTQMLARAGMLQAHGYAVLLYDARAHGRSGGEQTSFGWVEQRDLLGALAYLRGRGFREFGCIGASQGGATIALAAEHIPDVRWVVLESVYPTLIDAVDCRFRHTLGLPGWLLGCVMTPVASRMLGVSAEDIAPIEWIGKLRCPVLIMHGERDRHTYIESARALYAQAPEPKALWIVPGAAHVDLFGYAPHEYEERLFAFMRSHE